MSIDKYIDGKTAIKIIKNLFIAIIVLINISTFGRNCLDGARRAVHSATHFPINGELYSLFHISVV
jgi:hypothetical protein